MTENYWGQKTFCLVTGASRGIGRQIALDFAQNVGNGSVFLLTARSEQGLLETKNKIESICPGKCQVVIESMDLGKPNKDNYFQMIENALKSTNSKSDDFDHQILVHNAGTTGLNQKHVVQFEDLQELHDYFDCNVFSMILLTSQFFKIFNDAKKQRSIVQITSLCGVAAFKTMGLYGTGKAARDMLMKCVAEESGIQVLSWAPGPVESDMYADACINIGDSELRKMFNDNRNQGKILTTEKTIGKLVQVLESKKYIKGEHVDYFDVE